MKRVAIIGATGAIGRALLTKLKKEQVETYIFVRANSARKRTLPQDPLFHLVNCSMEQLSAFDETTLPRIDVFYNLAWANAFGQDARNDMDVQIKNVQYTLDAVRLAKRLGAEAFIGTGSQAEYGRVEGVLHPDTPCNPENGYGMAKLCAGQMSRVECEKLGLRHVWTRILSVYGPHDGAGTMVSSAIAQFSQGVSPAFTKGEQLWDYLYSDDAANALYLMGISGKHGAIYPLGSGTARPLHEYIQIICKQIDPAIIPAFGAAPYAPRQVMHLQADISALAQDTGFRPMVSFEEGISNITQMLRKNKTNATF